MNPIPRVPWQITGNHWVSVPCIHPGDASIHMIGAVHAGLKAAVELAGQDQFLDGTALPLFRATISRGANRFPLGAGGIAWEQDAGWIPTFNCRIGELHVRGVICAPHGRNADLSGVVFELTIENRGDAEADIVVDADGAFTWRQLRVRTPRAFGDAGRVIIAGNGAAILQSADAQAPVAVAIGASDSDATARADRDRWVIRQGARIPAGESRSLSFCIAVGQERDGAEAVLESMRRRGPSSLVSGTRAALLAMEPSTGNSTADRLISRHMFFAYFCSVARAIDDAHLYVMRSRVPWNGVGVTVRDWEALMWVLPAVQLADAVLARELLLRICDLHGYAPGAGVHYLDGSLFEPGFCLEGAAAFPIAVDEYIVQSADDKVVEEPLLAESLYNAHDDIQSRKHATLPLYSTETNPDGTVPDFPYTAHGNSVVALALDILSHTLDEKTAEKVQDPAAVRAAVLRHFADVDEGGKSVLTRAADLTSDEKSEEGASAAMYWLPYYDLLGRDDSIYRRSMKPLENVETEALFMRCARLVGPNGSLALEWLRRAPLDGGLASELVDLEGRATGNGGDAALSGLIAYTAWYAVHALGVKI
jgi:hypothetical protein